jgi:hypothetical protein
VRKSAPPDQEATTQHDCALSDDSGAHAEFVAACRATADRGGIVDRSLFGPVSVADDARFQALHARHHLRQMPGRH